MSKGDRTFAEALWLDTDVAPHAQQSSAIAYADMQAALLRLQQENQQLYTHIAQCAHLLDQQRMGYERRIAEKRVEIAVLESKYARLVQRIEQVLQDENNT